MQRFMWIAMQGCESSCNPGRSSPVRRPCTGATSDERSRPASPGRRRRIMACAAREEPRHAPIRYRRERSRSPSSDGTRVAHDATGCDCPSMRTRHIRHSPYGANRASSHNDGTSIPARSNACKTVKSSATSIVAPSTTMFTTEASRIAPAPARDLRPTHRHTFRAPGEAGAERGRGGSGAQQTVVGFGFVGFTPGSR